jgi:uncharacterized membrane protein
MTRRTALAGNIIQWLLVGLSIFWTVVLGPLTGVTTSTVLFVFAIPFFILHGLRRYGLRAILLFVVSTFIISNAFENFSILYRFPFGHYHYTGGMSWHTANVLLGLPDTRLDRWIDLVLLPVIAAAVMTMLDLTSDPGASTVARVWAWENGGGYFGVPATNFMGWWLITYVFFQIFAFTFAASVARKSSRIRANSCFSRPSSISTSVSLRLSMASPPWLTSTR